MTAGIGIPNSGILLTNYEKQIVEYVQNESEFRALVKAKKIQWDGSHLEWANYFGRMGSIGFGEDGSEFPAAASETYARAKCYRRAVYGSSQLSDGIMAAAGGGKGSLGNIVQLNLQHIAENFAQVEEFFGMRDGTGAVATVTATATSTSQKVDDARFLWRGKQVDDYTTTTFNLRSTITRVTNTLDATTANATVTIGASQLWTTGDKLYWVTGPSTGSNSYGRALSGLDTLVGTATLQGISTTTYPEYVSTVLSNSGTARELTPQLLRQGLSSIYQRVGNVPGGLVCLSTNWMANEWVEMYEGQLRFTATDNTYGSAAQTFQGPNGKLHLRFAPLAPYGQVTIFDPAEIDMPVQQDFQFRKVNGQTFLPSQNAAVYTATFSAFEEMRIKNRASACKITDLSEVKTVNR